MKFLFSYLLILIFLIQSVGNTFFLIDYQLSIEKYKSKCENVSKPELKCHGKCQMKKQSEKFGFWNGDHKQNSKSPSLKSIKLLDNFLDSKLTNTLLFSKASDYHFFYFRSYHILKIDSIFHPPIHLV